MQYFKLKLVWALLVGAGCAGLVFLITSTNVNPYINHVSKDQRFLAVLLTGVIAAVIFWVYEIWKDHFLKMWGYALASGIAFAAIAYVLTMPNGRPWTIYSFMNLVQPSVPVQKAFTFLGLGAGTALMMLLGPVAFKQRRFAIGMALGALFFLGTGYAISLLALPYFAQAHLYNGMQKPFEHFLMNFGLGVSVFVGAFAFFFTLLPSTHGFGK